MTKVQKL